MGEWIPVVSNGFPPIPLSIIRVLFLLLCISGSFILGILFYWLTHDSIPLWVWSVLGIGFCGAFTTGSLEVTLDGQKTHICKVNLLRLHSMKKAGRIQYKRIMEK
ncbi:hypothetical protein SAMN05443246_5962 [Paenibacillus sp. GP183]|nr:hypothetical protein SAMN05443246_5962 [Paenibacillus sp. GP183]